MIDRNQCILYLNKGEVKKLCGGIDSVAVVREVFRLHGQRQVILSDEAYLTWVNEEGEQVRSLNMPGRLDGFFHTVGTKIINSNIHNPARGLPRADGLTLLYDSITTRVTCIMDAAYISSLRTASVSALVADLLMQTEEVHSLAIIGAGVLAQAHIELLVKQLPHLRKLHIFDLVPARVDALKHELAGLLDAHNIAWHPATTAESAIRPAQLIIPVTTTTQGYIPFAWLQPGSLLINVSLDDPLPEVVLQAQSVIVDDWHLVKSDSRRLLGRMYRAGQILAPDEKTISGARKIDAQLGEIVTGKKAGRKNADDIILVNPFGLAIEDIAIASQVYYMAQEQGIGTLLQR